MIAAFESVTCAGCGRPGHLRPVDESEAYCRGCAERLAGLTADLLLERATVPPSPAEHAAVEDFEAAARIDEHAARRANVLATALETIPRAFGGAS